MDIRILNFHQLREEAISSPNKVSYAVYIFEGLHDDAPPEDFEGLGGRLAGIIKQANGDYLRVLQVMWIAAAMGIQGSHLHYIQGMLRNGKQVRGRKTSGSEDRDKYIKGHYGHMVQR